jgi:hypothetical protein
MTALVIKQGRTIHVFRYAVRVGQSVERLSNVHRCGSGT